MKTRTTVPGWMLLLLTGCLSAQTAATPDANRGHTTFAASGKLPLYFIENRGVYPDEVAYYVRGADKTLFFTKDGITLRLRGRDGAWVVKLEFVGANRDVVPRGEDRQQAVFSYFKGPEKDWKTGLRTYAKVVYDDLWPGIDLVYRGTVNRLKYDFVVKSGAVPGTIRLRYRGATTVKIVEAGGLRVETPVGELEDAAPVAWQVVEGERVPVELAFTVAGKTDEAGHEFGFRVGDYDPTLPLVLDPAVLVYCGYIGGTGHEEGRDIAVDTDGNAYVTGTTETDERTFPVRVGPDLTHNGGYLEAFVAKVNRQGTALVYCGYIGGVLHDYGYGIDVDQGGNAYVTGSAGSDHRSFPVTVGPDLSHNGGGDDAFVAKVNSAGTRLVYCGYVGGAGFDRGQGISVDKAGCAYLTGETGSDQQTFPVKLGPDLTYNGGLRSGDAFVAKVNPQGTALVYCGYIGGANDEFDLDIAVDGAGNAYVAGVTGSNQQTFPVTVGPDLSHNGLRDAFVAKVNAQGTGLAYCGYIGGRLYDYGTGIAVDGTGSAYVTGHTGSGPKTFPVRVGPDLTLNSAEDAFVAKVEPSGATLVYCGYIGGANGARGNGIAVNGAGNAYLVGDTGSDERSFPVKVGPDLIHNGNGDAFVARLNTLGTAFDYCGYIGGGFRDRGHGIAVDRAGNAYVVGTSNSPERWFPVTVGPDLTHNGVDDAFVARVALTRLEAGGTPRPGGTVNLDLIATRSAALQYQIGTSLGTGPISIGKRKLALSPDALLGVSSSGAWPSVFAAYRGVIDARGQARAAIHIPNIPALIGVRLHSAFVTLSPSASSGIMSISNTFMFSIAK